ncbi:MAG TPA: hypothetical protein PLO19_04900 [Candidatus Cryosericum sp.]|nr:hypothetical protein [Candidatus Cryosericum sp.]
MKRVTGVLSVALLVAALMVSAGCGNAAPTDSSSTANPQDGQSQVIYEDQSSGQTGTDQTPSTETPGTDDTTHVTSQGGVGQ